MTDFGLFFVKILEKPLGLSSVFASSNLEIRLPQNCYAPKRADFEMIFGEADAAIPTYRKDNNPKSAKKTPFRLVRIT